YMNRIFRDNELNHQMADEGYVVVNVLDSEAVQQLLAIHKNTDPVYEKGFYTSHMKRDVNYRSAIHRQVSKILAPKVLSYLENYKDIYGYFLVKQPGEGSEFRVHQDWAVVDESKYIGLTAWCALVDTNLANGCLHIVKRSHLFFNNLRGTGVEFPYSEIREEIESSTEMLPVPIKAGQAVIFDHRLVHYSPANNSTTNRIVAGLVAIPENAPVVHYYRGTAPDELNVYEESEDFLIKFGYGDSVAELNLSHSLNYPHHKITLQEWKTIYETHNP
ncbi:MAG TPA: phytanoyl-CoA dioxygenase family protein, partial [Chitinophagales bacterium]|nr:phytanoyl-CoA dioxygenase family protein [Chitinophagales bacterium]